MAASHYDGLPIVEVRGPAHTNHPAGAVAAQGVHANVVLLRGDLSAQPRKHDAEDVCVKFGLEDAGLNAVAVVLEDTRHALAAAVVGQVITYHVSHQGSNL